jgi:hypothetical protein
MRAGEAAALTVDDVDLPGSRQQFPDDLHSSCLLILS